MSSWIVSHIGQYRGYGPPRCGGLRQLGYERKALVGSILVASLGECGHGGNLCNRLDKIPGHRTLWTDDSRLDSREVGAACVWQSPAPGGWSGCRFHLGTNKEIVNAEVFAIYQALRVVDQRQESGHRYTVFADSTAAIDRVSTDALGPGQRLAIAAKEVCCRVPARDNEVTTLLHK